MTTDTGKHSALRQTSDGSFEIVYETGGLQEVSEVETSLPEAGSAEAPRVPREPASRRTMVMIGVGGIALLATVVIVAFAFTDRGGSSIESAEDLPLVPGFRPYGGGGADTRAAINRPPRTRRPAAAVVPEESFADEEIVENEEGWEVAEEPVVEEVIVEEEVIEEGVVEEEPIRAESEEPVDPRTLRAPRDLAPRSLGRPIEADKFPNPGMPNVNAPRGMYQDRLNRLPMRQLDPSSAQEAELEELPPEEELPAEEELVEELPADELPPEELPPEEVVEEEFVEEEVVEEY